MPAESKSNLNAKSLLVYASFALLTFILFNLNLHVSLWIFLVLKPFIHGVSNFKINFFVLYTLLLCLTLLGGKGVRSPRAVLLFKRTGFISILSAMLTGLFAFLSMAQKLKIPLDKYAYHFKGHYVSIDYFAHTHVTKLPLYYLTKLLRLDRLYEICDTALPLAGYVEPFLILALSLFILTALFCFVSLAYDVMAKWDKQKQGLVFLLYVFASGHIIKCLLDGGMFSYDLIPSLLAMHLLSGSQDPGSLAALWKKNALRYLLILLSFMLAGSAFSKNEAVLQTPIGSVFFICLFTLLFMGLSVKTAVPRNVLPSTQNPAALMPPYARTGERTRRQIKLPFKGFTLLFCCLYVIFYFNAHALRDIHALMRKVEKTDRILHYVYPPRNDQGFSPLLSDLGPTMRGQRIADVYAALGDSPFRNRNVAVIGPEDSKAYGFIFVLKVLKSKEEVKLPPNDFMKIQVLRNLSKVSEKAFLLKVTFNKDRFPSLWEMKPSMIGENNRFACYFFLNHYFLDCGIKEYIIIPYYFQISPPERE